MQRLFITALACLISVSVFGQDCEFNSINIEVIGSDEEIGWNITQDNGWAFVSGELGSYEDICLEDGCYPFNMYDGNGDGWIETTITISYSLTNEIIFSGTLEEGSVEALNIQIGDSIECPVGCTDPSASNYDPDATEDDGSCDYPPGPCNNQTLITYQGYEYDIVEIGDQCWFAENCRYLPAVSPSSEGSEVEPYYYVYDYEGTDVSAATSTENYQTYGVLYNWPAVMSEEICPSGWHIPSDEDWQTMEIYLGMSDFEAFSELWRGTNQGFQMKSMSGWSNLMSDGTTGNGNGSNASGLNALPSGYCVSTTGFENLYNLAYFWTPSILDNESYIRSVNKNFDTVMRYLHPTNYGFSVRCIKDEPLHYDGNGDGCVNIQDMLDLLLEYGQCEPESQLDFDGNGDGCVNGEDVLNILVEYGSCE